MKPLFTCFLLIISLGFTCTNTQKSTTNAHSEAPQTPNEIKKGDVVMYQNIGKDAFREGITDNPRAVIMDVRTPAEIAQGKIDNSIMVDYKAPDFMEQISRLDKSKAYYVYCRSGNRSEKTARIMVKQGFEEVYNLKGGYLDWTGKK